MNYNELTQVQKHVVRAMHYISMSKSVHNFVKYSPVEFIFNKMIQPDNDDRLGKFHEMCVKTNGDIWRRAYQNGCLRLAEIPKRILGYTNDIARREARVVVDYVRAEYRRMNSGLSKIS